MGFYDYFSPMALFGNIHDLAKLLAADSRFDAAFQYLNRCRIPGSDEDTRIRNMAAGVVEKIPLEHGAFALDQVYLTRQRGDCFYESHRRYIDVQCILEGEEVIDVVAIPELEIEKPFHEAKDLIIYKDVGQGSRLKLHAGQAAVFFPEDGHMPGQFPSATGLVRKTVIKVPVGP